MSNLLTEVSKMKNIMGLQEADKPKYSPEVKTLINFLKAFTLSGVNPFSFTITKLS